MTDWKSGGIEVDQPNPQSSNSPGAGTRPHGRDVDDSGEHEVGNPEFTPPELEAFPSPTPPPEVSEQDGPTGEGAPETHYEPGPGAPEPETISQFTATPIPEPVIEPDDMRAGVDNESAGVLIPPLDAVEESAAVPPLGMPVPDGAAAIPVLTHGELARGRPLPRAVAVANQKGGVGKTTTAVNLGAGLAELGFRVLVVDLDPQGNATTGLGINPRNLTGSVYDVLMNDAPLEDCVEPTAVRNLFVVPATIDLAGAEIELVPAFSRELKLRRAIDRLAGEFDFTLIDCPPSLGLLTVNGLAAAGEVLVPIQCEYYALEGLGQLIKNIQLVQSNLNPRLELSTIVLTMYDARTRLSDQVAKDVREHFGSKVCRTIVPRTVRLSEAPSFGQPINVFDPSSRGATAYRELAKEVSGGAARRSG